MGKLNSRARVVAFSATYSTQQLNSITSKLEMRGTVSRLSVEEQSSIGKVPDNIKVVNLVIDCKGGLGDQLKAKMNLLDGLCAALKNECFDPEETGYQVIFFHNFKAHALQIQKVLRHQT